VSHGEGNNNFNAYICICSDPAAIVVFAGVVQMQLQLKHTAKGEKHGGNGWKNRGRASQQTKHEEPTTHTSEWAGGKTNWGRGGKTAVTILFLLRPLSHTHRNE